MNIREFLAPSDVAIDVPARDKSALLRELSARAASVLRLPAKMVAEEIAKRDDLGSTGIGGGACLPHARLREVKRPFGLLVRLKDRIPFEAIDDKPVDIVFLLLLPASSQLEQLNALAAVARKLSDAGVLHKLRAASSADALYWAITS
jgi:PTS system nitrogen regulatory IIA component